MKRMSIFSICIAAMAAAGCQDIHAKKLLTQDTTVGRVPMALLAPNDGMVRFGKIDSFIAIETADKTMIDAWIIKPNLRISTQPSKVKGTVVILHGLNESKVAFPYFGTAKCVASLGYDAVLIDLRAHGRSSGKYITYGAKEKHDVKAVMDRLVSEKVVNGKIYVVGANLGGAVAIQYAAIDPRVAGVLALAPYQDFRTIAKWQISMNPVYYQVMTNERFQQTIKHATEIGDFSLIDTSSLEAVKILSEASKPPIVFVHGLLDLQVPMEQTQTIFNAYAGPKKLVVITPGPEQAGLALILEDWLAQQIDKIAQGQYDATGSTTKPAN